MWDTSKCQCGIHHVQCMVQQGLIMGEIKISVWCTSKMLVCGTSRSQYGLHLKKFLAMPKNQSS
jgi:hypothetical protein